MVLVGAPCPYFTTTRPVSIRAPNRSSSAWAIRVRMPTGSDDDDAVYPCERVLVRTDRELVVTDPNLPTDCPGINGLQPRPTQPGEDSFGSWLPDADLHHASYGSLSCLKQRLGHVCRGTLT